MKLRFMVAIAITSFSTPSFSQNQSCADYPLGDGISIEAVENGGVKILSTSSVSVAFDDADTVSDARDEATIAAKTLISKWMSEMVSSDEAIDKAVKQTTTMQGDSKEAKRVEVVDRVKKLRNSSAALLRGVVPLGDCYTPKKIVRVTVGLKPETIAQAESTAGSINQSLAKQPTPSSNQSNSGSTQGSNSSNPSQPLNQMPGYNNSQRLNKF